MMILWSKALFEFKIYEGVLVVIPLSLVSVAYPKSLII